MSDSIGIACVGAGNWGKNLVRVFHGLGEADLRYICDAEAKTRQTMERMYPDTAVVRDYGQVLDDKQVDAVVLAVPAAQHFKAARQALDAGKHVFVEKPMTLNVPDARALVELAEQAGRILMVGHLLEYHPAVQMLKELIEKGELGDVYYLYSQRVNLGVIRQDENALWSFAPHDVSTVLYLLGQEPDSVSARGECYLQVGIEDVVFVNMHFPDGKMAQLQLSWLDPHKIRKLTIVGSRKMVVFDDVESAEKVRIYDKSAERRDFVSYGDAISLRFGDVVIPHLEMAEPLALECRHFVKCVFEGREPRSGGRDGLRVVQVLEVAQKSLEQDGAPVAI